MPAKRQITKEAIVEAAVEMAKRGGIETINARNLAKELNCSTQPIYFSFENMEELKKETIQSISELHKTYIETSMKEQQLKSDIVPYKAYGIAYIQFAKQQKELYKVLFMRDRTMEQQISGKSELDGVIRMVQAATGLEYEDAYQLQMEVWFCVHGIASMIATNYIELDDDSISHAVTNCFEGLKKQHKEVVKCH